jgi:hypothetical protein
MMLLTASCGAAGDPSNALQVSRPDATADAQGAPIPVDAAPADVELADTSEIQPDSAEATDGAVAEVTDSAPDAQVADTPDAIFSEQPTVDSAPLPTCGNSLCEPAKGEDGTTCAKDCEQAAKACAGKFDANPCQMDPCITGQVCWKGVCQGGVPQVCEDGNACTVDACDAKTGCKSVAAPTGTKCDDGDPCTSSSACIDDMCLGSDDTCATACKDTPITCGGATLQWLNGPAATSVFKAYECAPGVAVPGKEVGIKVTASCNTMAALVIRVIGKFMGAPGAPQAALIGFDAQGAAQKCGASSAACMNVGTKGQPCGTASKAPPGCIGEWSVVLQLQAGEAQRVIVDTPLASEVSAVSAELLSCGCDLPNVCGDGLCGPQETAAGCPKDCAQPPVCGNGQCEQGEKAICPGDCIGKACGDQKCDPDANESCTNCPGDCGPCNSKCGDTICAPGEDCEKCPEDCGKCTGGKAVCGDQKCEIGKESPTTCKEDCGDGTCGDGKCWKEKEYDNCLADCSYKCGDGVCELPKGEDKETCPADCK